MADPPGVAKGSADEALAAIRDHFGRIRLGSIALTIDERRIVQRDVTERRRLSPT